jgi:hypothetical protein
MGCISLLPDLLLAAQDAVTARTPAADDELLHAQLKRLERKVEAVAGERRPECVNEIETAGFRY